MTPTIKATSWEVIVDHVKVARKLAKQVASLPLGKIRAFYSKHPQRAMPPPFTNK